MDLIQVRFIIGLIGSVSTIGYLVYPAPLFVAMYKNKPVDRNFSPNLLVDTIMHDMVWFFYGLVNKDSSILVPSLSALALGFEGAYLTVFFMSCGDKKDLCRSIMSRLLVRIIGMVAIVLITLFAMESYSAKVTLVGVISQISFILVMARKPLVEMEIAVLIGSAEHMSYRISIVSVISGMVWGAYSCIYKFDLYLFISSVIQILVSGSKLIIYFHYHKRTPKVKSE